MSKSKNKRGKQFMERIKYNKAIAKTQKNTEKAETKNEQQEEPSIIAQRILMKRLRGHIGKSNDEELEK